MMRRMILVIAVAALMAAMMAVSALPAFATTVGFSGGTDEVDEKECTPKQGPVKEQCVTVQEEEHPIEASITVSKSV